MSDGEDSRNGIGGWLAIFLVSLCGFLLDALIGLVSSLGSESRTILLVQDIDTAHQAATIVLCGMAVVSFLWMRSWLIVRLGIVILWLLPTLQFAHDSFQLWHFTGALQLPGLGLALLLTYSAAWTAYLLRSRRVANTYPRALSEDSLAEIFE